MKPQFVIHRLAILLLFVVASMSIIGSICLVPGAPIELKLAPVFGFAIWAWLLWKIWKRPRKWGLGVGIFLFLMIALQSYLWWLGVNNPTPATLNVERSTLSFIVIYELPIFIAGVCCTLLRFYFPNDSSDSSAKGAEQE